MAKDLLYFMQICITTSTSAGLEQILPWIFYHKVIGVTTFFLFVEGKAAKPNITAVLESIPVRPQYPHVEGMAYSFMNFPFGLFCPICL